MAKTKINLPASFYAEEDRALKISAETKRLWAVELDLFCELKRVCDKYGIKYFAISGTLIGAARHHGFIPWDNDMDVVMMRSEYKKLEAVAKDEFKEPYFFQTNYTDPGSLSGHAQLRNSSTTAILGSEMYNGVPLCSFNQGVFLDIFPLDKLPDDASERQDFIQKLRRLKAHMKTMNNWNRIMTHRRLYPKTLQWFKILCHWSLMRIKERLSGRDLLAESYDEFEKLAQSYNDSDFKECSPIAFSQALRKHEVFRVADFDSCIELDFETLKIPCPKNYDEVLTRAFGDWHKHVIGDNSHGKLLLDLDKSYREYLK